MTNRISITLLAALTLCLPFGADASSISVQVNGVVTLVDNDGGLVSASVGDAWSIRYVVSSIASPDSCELGDQSCYFGVVQSMTSTIAGNSVTVMPAGEFSNYQVSWNMSFFLNGRDGWTVRVDSSEYAVPPPDLRYNMGVELYGPGDSALVVDESYLPVPDLAYATRSLMSFGATRYFEDFSYDTDDFIQGRVTSISQIISVPEPSAAWLIFGGLLALVATTGRRRLGINQ
jgi:hypothetical protein